jgi:hypothetical protein
MSGVSSGFEGLRRAARGTYRSSDVFSLPAAG